jgi:hypothetical protein
MDRAANRAMERVREAEGVRGLDSQVDEGTVGDTELSRR